MFDFLRKLFAAHVKTEWEADLHPTPECGDGGKAEIEIEIQSNQPTKVEAAVKYSSIPDGSELEVHFGGECVMSFNVYNGYAKKKELLDAAVVPMIQAGDEAQICFQGVILYRGQFRRD